MSFSISGCDTSVFFSPLLSIFGSVSVLYSQSAKKDIAITTAERATTNNITSRAGIVLYEYFFFNKSVSVSVRKYLSLSEPSKKSTLALAVDSSDAFTLMHFLSPYWCFTADFTIFL